MAIFLTIIELRQFFFFFFFYFFFFIIYNFSNGEKTSFFQVSINCQKKKRENNDTKNHFVCFFIKMLYSNTKTSKASHLSNSSFLTWRFFATVCNFFIAALDAKAEVPLVSRIYTFLAFCHWAIILGVSFEALYRYTIKFTLQI